MGYEDPLELDRESMRRMGYRVVDMLVERVAGLDDGPAWQGGDRAAMRDRVGETAPVEPASFDALLDHLADNVLPFAGRIDHPRFFAFVPSCPTWPGVLGDLVAAGHSIFQGTWLESAGPSTLELLVLDWFKSWVGYPRDAAGLLTSGGSAANLTALVCAREASGHETDEAVIYASDQAHSSMIRAARILGFRPDQVRTVAADREQRMDPVALRTAIARDRAAGRAPLVVTANGGATSTGAVDPLGALADMAGEEGLWLHVDAAYGGFAVLTERGRRLLDGLDRAHSITLDPHKWLFQPYEAGCLLVREGRRLPEAFHIMPDYLQDTVLEDDDAGADAGPVNFADRGVQLTRYARAIKIWLSLRTFGLDAFRDAIDHALDLTERAEAWIRDADTLELLSPARLGVVCFRRTAGAGEDGRDVEHRLEARNTELVQRLSESGIGMISSTRVGGLYALRLCVLNHRSRWVDVKRVLEFLATEAVDGGF